MRAAFAITRTLRISSVRTFAPVALPRRCLATTARRLANETPDPASDPASDPQILALREKIQNHAGCRDAIVKLGELMAKKGVDVTKPPSTMQMMKLGMDSEIREAGANLMAQLKEAGVEMNPEVASQIFSKVVKD